MLPATNKKKFLLVSLVILPVFNASSTSERKFCGNGKGSGRGFSDPLHDIFLGRTALATELFRLGEEEGGSRSMLVSSSELNIFCPETHLLFSVIVASFSDPLQDTFLGRTSLATELFSEEEGCSRSTLVSSSELSTLCPEARLLFSVFVVSSSSLSSNGKRAWELIGVAK